MLIGQAAEVPLLEVPVPISTETQLLTVTLTVFEGCDSKAGLVYTAVT